MDPLYQFKIERWVEFKLFGLDLAFTNSAFFALVATLSVIVFLAIGSRKRELVPGRLQLMSELLYGFVANIVRSTMGPAGWKFFPLTFSIFAFVLACNLLGMVPYFFTVTSHIAVTLALSMMVFIIVIGYGLYKHGFKFFKLFAPSGLPILMYILIIPVEIISFLSRPLSLAVRLFANMMAGHALMKVFAGFVVMLGGAGGVLTAFAIVPLLTNSAVIGLEFLIAFLQAYVFTLLTCIYLNDIVQEHVGH